MRPRIHTLLLTILILVLHLSAAVDHEIAVVTKVRGLVMTSYGNTGTQTLTSRGALIFNLASIHTGSKGMAQVRFIKSGTTVLILEGSEVQFTLEGNSETARVESGKAILDAEAPRDGSFDAATPVTMSTTPSKSATLVTHDDQAGNSAFFLTGGTTMMTDPSFSDWYPYNAPTAMYVHSGTPVVYASALTTDDSTRLHSFVQSARAMKVSGPLTHTLIIQPDSGGRVQPGDTMTALQNFAVSIVAHPDPGYVFSRWEVLNGAAVIENNTVESTTVTVTTDARIAARFTNTPATLVVESTRGGTTNPESTLIVPRYRPFRISAHPQFGYVCRRWNVSKGVEVVASDSLMATVILNGGTGRVIAEFGLRRTTCDVSATAGGSVTPGMNAKVLAGDSLHIKAIPGNGYAFISWNIIRGRAAIGNSRSAATAVRCDSGDVQIRARFHKKNQTVRVKILPHECAVITPSNTVVVPRNEPLKLHATLKTGYELKRWVSRLGRVTVSGQDNGLIRAAGDCELIPEIVTKTFHCTVNAKGPGTTSPTGMTKVFYNTPATIHAKAEEGKKFASWKVIGGNATIDNPRSPTTSVTLSSTDAVIAAQFAASICTLIVDATPGGYVEPADTQILIQEDQVALKAVPNPQAAFLGWTISPDSGFFQFSDTVTSLEQVLTCQKPRSVKVTAQFSTQTVELTILNNGLGVTDPVKKLWVPQNRWMQLKADPADGNKFLHWVIVSGVKCEVKDQFSMATELNPGMQNATIKALFDTSSGYPSPEFRPSVSGGEYRLSIENEREKGTVEPAGPLTLRNGIPVTLEAKPLPGYVFEEWVITQGEAVISDRFNQSTSVILTRKDVTVSCRFASEKPHVIKARFIGPDNTRKTIEIPYR